MKISLINRIQLFALAGCSLFIILVVSILMIVQSLELAFKREGYARQIDNQTNVLTHFIINDNLYSRETINKNTLDYQQHLAEILEHAPALTPSQQTIQNSIQSQNNNLKRLFEQIESNNLDKANKVIKVHLNARLVALLEAIRADSVELSAMVQDDIQITMHRQAIIVILVLIISISILSISSYRLINIFKISLKEIKNAIENNDPNSHKKIKLSYHYQEFYDIVEKFNLMNQKLSKTTVSLDEMKKIVADRTKVLEHLSKTDQLTKVANRRALFERGEQECSRGKRNNSNLTVILMDCDFFKSINDQYGHLVGDELLKHICKICNQEIRNIDFLARYGGEEFIILLPDCDIQGGIDIAKRIQNSLAKHGLVIKEHEIFITVSIGITTLTNKHNNFIQLINDADQAMYLAKKNGRNKIEIVSDK